MTMTEKYNLWPVLITVIGLGLLSTLGTWQLSRMTEKNALLELIDARAASAPVPLPLGAIDPEEWEYRKVSVTGKLLHDDEIHLYAIGTNGRPGFRVITPLIREAGLPVLVDRGWVPEALKAPKTRIAGQLAGGVRIDGTVSRGGTKFRFTPENNLAENRWYYADLEGMALAVGLGEHMPVIIRAGPADNPGGYPKGGVTAGRLANNHLFYAITWYSLALGLAGVFLIYRRRPRA